MNRPNKWMAQETRDLLVSGQLLTSKDQSTFMSVLARLGDLMCYPFRSDNLSTVELPEWPTGEVPALVCKTAGNPYVVFAPRDAVLLHGTRILNKAPAAPGVFLATTMATALLHGRCPCCFIPIENPRACTCGLFAPSPIYMAWCLAGYELAVLAMSRRVEMNDVEASDLQETRQTMVSLDKDLARCCFALTRGAMLLRALPEWPTGDDDLNRFYAGLQAAREFASVEMPTDLIRQEMDNFLFWELPKDCLQRLQMLARSLPFIGIVPKNV